jgi:segregation and condensation protein A
MSVYLESELPKYSIKIPVYQGPLDLLLSLIERAELDITKIALAQVTHQYLEYLNQLKDKNAEEISSFLVIAAKLIQIKSEVLLPRPSTSYKEEVDVGEELVLQLKTYKKFKEMAQFLDFRQQSGYRTYIRLALPPSYQPKLELQKVSLNDLVQTAFSVLGDLNQSKFSLDTVISPPRITIRQRIQWIIATLRNYGRTTFLTIIGKERTKSNIVVTFLAMLELIKRNVIRIHQPYLFSDIEIEANESWNGQQFTEVEFDDE